MGKRGEPCYTVDAPHIHTAIHTSTLAIIREDDTLTVTQCKFV